MKETLIKKYWQEEPLKVILFAGIFFRLISVFFSKGWGMHDDHFLVIESAQSWVDGYDYNNWLPSENNATPPGHSFLYPGLHYLLFSLLKLIHIYDPQVKMYFVRALHAAFSLITIIFGYRLTEKISGSKENAKMAGLLFSIYWFMPFLSVRNLVEVVSSPLLIIAIWLIINYCEEKEGEGTRYKRAPAKESKNTSERLMSIKLLFAGILLGISFSIRMQTIIFTGGILSVLLFQKKWKQTVTLILGILISILLFEGLTDYLIWGYPFAEIKEYINYNVLNAYNYLTQPWYTYLLFISGILIPPVSIFLFIGFFKVWKKHLIIFLPTFLFLAFHSYFPNKQERFILTIIPFIIILGVIGWNEIMSSKIKIQNSKFIKGSWVFFWIVNILFLPVISSVYSKKARVESMIYLSKYKNIDFFIQEGTSKIPPRYYLGQWAKYECFTLEFNDNKKMSSYDSNVPLPIEYKGNFPKFVLFYDDKNLSKRVDVMKKFMPNLKYETTIEPGFIDKVLYKLNPNNSNQVIYIYKNMYYYSNLPYRTLK